MKNMNEILDKRGLTEYEAIERFMAARYPKPSLTADILVFSKSNNTLKILLIKRGGHPFLGKFALPGGFAEENETIENTAARELFEETGVKDIPLQLIGIFSKPGRDPRGWVVSAAFAAVVDADNIAPSAGDDAADAAWFAIDKDAESIVLYSGDIAVTLDALAFDHGEMIACALEKLGLLI